MVLDLMIMDRNHDLCDSNLLLQQSQYQSFLILLILLVNLEPSSLHLLLLHELPLYVVDLFAPNIPSKFSSGPKAPRKVAPTFAGAIPATALIRRSVLAA